MPVARYFLFVGGISLAPLFALDAFAPQQMVVGGNAAPSINKTVVRICSDQNSATCNLRHQPAHYCSAGGGGPDCRGSGCAGRGRWRPGQCATPLPSSSRPRPGSLKSSLRRKPRASARSPRSVRLCRCALPSNRTLDSASSEAIPGKPSRITREHLYWCALAPATVDRQVLSFGVMVYG